MQKIRSHEWDVGIQGCLINTGRINEGRLYIGIIVFRLLKHNDELDIKPPTLLGGYITWGTDPCAPPGYGPAKSFSIKAYCTSNTVPKSLKCSNSQNS